MNYNSIDYSKQERIIDVKTSINPKKITQYLLIIVAVLVGLSTLGHLAVHHLPDFPMRDFVASKFALNKEQNFPTLYSSLALFYCATLFLLIGYLKMPSHKKEYNSWKGLAIIFLYLSIDELVGLHESFSKPLHRLGVDGVLHNAWVVPGIIAVVIFFMSFYKFFLTLPNYLKRLILIAMFLWVGGALFVETVGGYYKYIHGADNLGYALITTVEEVMEMLGVIVLIHGLLTYIDKMGQHQINFSFNLGPNRTRTSELNATKS